jgi:hypothetical protein
MTDKTGDFFFLSDIVYLYLSVAVTEGYVVVVAKGKRTDVVIGLFCLV